MLKLMPILEHMGACDESKAWIREKKFATFAEACEACPHGGWIDFLVVKLSKGNSEANALLKGWGGGWFADYYAPHHATIERWLVEYAHKHGCAVEVSP